jgi:hypothetical protein
MRNFRWTPRTWSALLAGLTLALAALVGQPGSASMICGSSGGCQICHIYNPDGSYGGYIKSGCT